MATDNPLRDGLRKIGDPETLLADERARVAELEARVATLTEERDRELNVCPKCEHRQAEPNWCQKCGHRPDMRPWATAFLARLDNDAGSQQRDLEAEVARAEAAERGAATLREALEAIAGVGQLDTLTASWMRDGARAALARAGWSTEGEG